MLGESYFRTGVVEDYPLFFHSISRSFSIHPNALMETSSIHQRNNDTNNVIHTCLYLPLVSHRLPSKISMMMFILMIMCFIIRKTSERKQTSCWKTKNSFRRKKEEETIEYNKYTRKIKGNLIFTLYLWYNSIVSETINRHTHRRYEIERERTAVCCSNPNSHQAKSVGPLLVKIRQWMQAGINNWSRVHYL